MSAEQRRIDKSKWGNGPWQDEPDRIDFEHAGLPCLMLRGPVGAWCGYAAVPPGHAFHGKHYDEVPADAHGGLTYAGSCSGEICHVAKQGEPDDVWWFGFDCAHAGDVAPESEAFFRERGHAPFRGSVYRNAAYVRAEVEQLAEQLANAARSAAPPTAAVAEMEGDDDEAE